MQFIDLEIDEAVQIGPALVKLMDVVTGDRGASGRRYAHSSGVKARLALDAPRDVPIDRAERLRATAVQ